MRVLTWNIHGCLGTDGHFSPDRTAAVLHHIGADIVALQEVYAGRPGTDGFDGFAFFREHCGPHAVRAVTIDDSTQRYGHMVCTRWPVVWSSEHDVSVAGREPRRIIDMAVRHPNGVLRVLASHFGLRAGERQPQSQTLHDLLRLHPDTPTVVLGDFNEVRRGGGLFRAIDGMVTRAPAPATYPARLPLFALDRILGRPEPLIREVTAWRRDRPASDHLPLLATLDFG